MYSPYCLTQVWDRGKRRWGAPLLKFFRCRAPPLCVCAVCALRAARCVAQLPVIYCALGTFFPTLLSFGRSCLTSSSRSPPLTLSPPVFLMALLQQAFSRVSLRMVRRENGASPKSILYKTEVGEKRQRRALGPDSWLR